MTPLPIDTMRKIVMKMDAKGAEDESEDAALKRQFTTTMLKRLEEVAANAKPGDSITFDDLSWATEDALGRTGEITPDAFEDTARAAESETVQQMMDSFTRQFDQSPELAQMGDDIDSFTVHPGVHSYQQERANSRPNQDLHGEAYGENGRWIAERRGGATVYVTPEQQQVNRQVEHEERVADALNAVTQAYEQTPATPTPQEKPHQTQNELSDKDSESQRMLDKIPDDARERVLFQRENFAEVSREKIPLLAAFMQKELQGVAARVPENSRFPDTVAGVIGAAGEAWQFLHAYVSARSGSGMIDPGQFNRMPFSEVADMLGLDVKKIVPDYEKRFRT